METPPPGRIQRQLLVCKFEGGKRSVGRYLSIEAGIG